MSLTDEVRRLTDKLMEVHGEYHAMKATFEGLETRLESRVLEALRLSEKIEESLVAKYEKLHERVTLLESRFAATVENAAMGAVKKVLEEHLDRTGKIPAVAQGNDLLLAQSEEGNEGSDPSTRSHDA